jgi:hypothetical protein
MVSERSERRHMTPPVHTPMQGKLLQHTHREPYVTLVGSQAMFFLRRDTTLFKESLNHLCRKRIAVPVFGNEANESVPPALVMCHSSLRVTKFFEVRQSIRNQVIQCQLLHKCLPRKLRPFRFDESFSLISIAHTLRGGVNGSKEEGPARAGPF